MVINQRGFWLMSSLNAAASTFIVISILVSMGCGLSYEVGSKMTDALRVEYKLSLFDAENSLVIALDEMDHLEDQLIRLRKKKMDIEKQVLLSEMELEHANDNSKRHKIKEAQLTVQTLEMELDYEEEEIEYIEDKLAAQDVFVQLASAKLELEKAHLVLKNNLTSEAVLSLDDFKNQVKHYAATAKEVKEDLSKQRQIVDEARKRWQDTRSKLSSGGLGSIWSDHRDPWGTTP
jgi:hypothetical protein